MTKIPIRCSKCDKLLFFINEHFKFTGIIEIKCTRCKEVETIKN